MLLTLLKMILGISSRIAELMQVSQKPEATIRRGMLMSKSGDRCFSAFRPNLKATIGAVLKAISDLSVPRGSEAAGRQFIE